MIKAAIAASEQSQHMSAEDKEDLYHWMDYIWLNRIRDEKIKAEILSNFKKGDIERMKSGFDFMVEKEREEAQKEERIKNAKSLLDILDIGTIIKKFKLTDEEAEILKLEEAK